MGVDRGSVARLVRRGEFWRPAPAVLARCVPPDDPDDHALLRSLAHLVRRPRFHAAHETALRLHGLPLLGRSTGVHLAGPTSSARERAGAHLHPAASPPEAVRPPGCQNDWPASGIAQALADMARRPGVRLGEAMVPLDAAWRAGWVEPADVVSRVPAGGRGVARVRQLVNLADAAAESPGETLTRLLLARAGKRWVSQVRFWLGSQEARVDFVLPDDGVILEFDGLVKYRGDEGPDVLVREKQREDALRALGYGVVRLVWKDLYRNHAVEYLVGSIRATAPRQLPEPLA